MDKLSYRRHRFPSIVIQEALWLYFRFALSYRDVEDMLAERGIDVSYETVAERSSDSARARRSQSMLSRGKSINLMQTVPSGSTYPLSYL